MKILEKDGKFEKVPNDHIAEQKVKLYGYKYSKKEEWRKNVRDARKLEEISDPETQKTISEKFKTKERRAKNHKKIYDSQKHQ